jgi:hypothetical protein
MAKFFPETVVSEQIRYQILHHLLAGLQPQFVLLQLAQVSQQLIILV